MILVTGLDFSGTSATAGLLYHLGCDFGEHVDTDGTVFPVLPWVTYECLPITLAMANDLAAEPTMGKADAQARLWARLDAQASRAVVKNNFPCILGRRHPAVSCLIVTERDEGERQQSLSRYLGIHAQHPGMRAVDRWMCEGYRGVMCAADLIVDFRDLYDDPWYVIWNLIRVTGIHPSDAQRQAARQSLRARSTAWPLELHHSLPQS